MDEIRSAFCSPRFTIICRHCRRSASHLPGNMLSLIILRESRSDFQQSRPEHSQPLLKPFSLILPWIHGEHMKHANFRNRQYEITDRQSPMDISHQQCTFSIQRSEICNDPRPRFSEGRRCAILTCCNSNETSYQAKAPHARTPDDWPGPGLHRSCFAGSYHPYP